MIVSSLLGDQYFSGSKLLAGWLLDGCKKESLLLTMEEPCSLVHFLLTSIVEFGTSVIKRLPHLSSAMSFHRATTSFCCYPDASPSFIEDVLGKETDTPDIRTGEAMGQPTPGAALKCTVVRSQQEARNYGVKKKPCSVYKLVLMDGSKAMFSAVLNSGLTHKIIGSGKDFLPGSTVTIHDYALIWMNAEHYFEWKMVMLIKKFEWNPAPNMGYNSSEVVVGELATGPVDFLELTIETDAVDNVDDNHVITHLEPMQHCNATVWGMVSDIDFHRKGLFITDESIQQNFVSLLKKRKFDPPTDWSDSEEKNRRDHPCECITRFHLTDCILSAMPLKEVDTELLFLSVCSRLSGNVEASEFGLLSPRHKRWSFYWCYAVNIHELTGKGNCAHLPKCFTDAVRLRYPNPNGQAYTGFKSAEERSSVKK